MSSMCKSKATEFVSKSARNEPSPNKKLVNNKPQWGGAEPARHSPIIAVSVDPADQRESPRAADSICSAVGAGVVCGNFGGVYDNVAIIICGDCPTNLGLVKRIGDVWTPCIRRESGDFYCASAEIGEVWSRCVAGFMNLCNAIALPHCSLYSSLIIGGGRLSCVRSCRYCALVRGVMARRRFF